MEIGVEEQDGDVRFFTGSVNTAVSRMRNASGHNYWNSSFIIDVAMGQILRSTERISSYPYFWSVESQENHWNCCHQMSYFKAKMHKIRFLLGLRPRPRWGSLQRSPDPLAIFQGPTSKGSGKGRESFSVFSPWCSCSRPTVFVISQPKEVVLSPFVCVLYVL